MTGRRADGTGGGPGDAGRVRSFGVPDYAAMFRGHDGRRPVEDGFCRPAGAETGSDADGQARAS